MKWGESSSTTLVQVQYLVWRLMELKLLEVNSKEVYCSHDFEVVGYSFHPMCQLLQSTT